MYIMEVCDYVCQQDIDNRLIILRNNYYQVSTMI